MQAATHISSAREVFTWNDGRFDDNHNAVLDDIAILFLVGLLDISCVDNLAVAADAHVLINDTLLHLCVGPCTDMQLADAALSTLSAEGQCAACA